MNFFWSNAETRSSSKTKTYNELLQSFTLRTIRNCNEYEILDIIDDITDCYCNYSTEFVYATRIINEWFQHKITNSNNDIMWQVQNAGICFMANIVLFMQLKCKRKILTKATVLELENMYKSHHAMQAYLIWQLTFGYIATHEHELIDCSIGVKTGLLVIVEISKMTNPNFKITPAIKYLETCRKKITNKRDIMMFHKYIIVAHSIWNK